MASRLMRKISANALQRVTCCKNYVAVMKFEEAHHPLAMLTKSGLPMP
jgi:hypothetical protein